MVAGFSYSSTLNIEMIKGNAIPALQTGPQAAAASSQAGGGVINESTSAGDATKPTPARTAITPLVKPIPASETPNPAKRLEDLNTMLKKG